VPAAEWEEFLERLERFRLRFGVEGYPETVFRILEAAANAS